MNKIKTNNEQTINFIVSFYDIKSLAIALENNLEGK